MKKYTYPPFGVKLKTWVLLGVSLLVGTISYGQSIQFNYTDGTNSAYDLQEVRKLTFDKDVMNLHLWDGSVYTWNLGTIGNYQYVETSLNVQDWLNNANAWEVQVYPNPTSTFLNIRFKLPKADEISIVLVDLQGTIILEKKIGNRATGEHKEILNLNNIKQGTYVCRISSKQNTITKQVIKQ